MVLLLSAMLPSLPRVAGRDLHKEMLTVNVERPPDAPTTPDSGCLASPPARSFAGQIIWAGPVQRCLSNTGQPYSTIPLLCSCMDHVGLIVP